MADRVLGVGVDFGTTNSTVAVYAGEVMPTALYPSRDRQASVGRAAIDRYTRDNSGRTVHLSAEEVGAITRSFEVHAWTDPDLPGRLFRSAKAGWAARPSTV